MKQLFIIGFIFFCINSFAQNDNKAQNILEQVSKKTEAFETIKASFSYSMENENAGMNEAYKGSIDLNGKKYHVTIPEMGVEIFSDGQTIWTYMEDGNQVTISLIDEESDELLDPAKIFQIYKGDFNFEFVSEKSEGGTVLYLIDLIPQNEGEDFSKITIKIDKSKMMIQSGIVYDFDGGSTTIIIDNMVTNQSIPDSFFVFDKSKYKDLEVIDFR